MTSESDPRILKTKRRLKHALIDLLKKQDVQTLSVQQLTEAAAVTRGTFYLHYRDKLDFIQTILEDFTKDLFQMALVDGQSVLAAKIQVTEHQVQVFSLKRGFHYIADNYEAFNALFHLNDNKEFEKKMTLSFRQSLLEFAQKTHLDQNNFSQIKMTFLVAGLIGTIESWLAQDMIYSPRFMANKVSDLMHEKTASTLDISDFFVA
ncbi:TetR/AcrR family transcriptional regulator [Pediococcus siamensis]|uniref:TetR/AcrR family transcriptional regulator n=1 Tax=Pediococcus siamensis TaxID=381829 RepID=UPI00399F4B8D